MKKHRFNLERPTNFFLGFYSQLFLIVTALLLVMTLPLVQQPIPLHRLAAIKTKIPVLAPVIITLHPEGQYTLNAKHHSDQLLSLDSMKSSLEQQLKVMNTMDITVCLRIHPRVTYEHIAEIIEWLNSLSVQHVGFLHEKIQ